MKLIKEETGTMQLIQCLEVPTTSNSVTMSE